MQEYQRKQLLERVNKESATIGADIPDRIEVQGEELDLRTFVFEIKRRDTIPDGEHERVEQAKRNLRRERLERLERIEKNRVDFETGEEIAASIIGIDRALDALDNLRSADMEGEARRQEAMDQKRWMSFLKKALGRDDASGSKRGGY